MSSEGEAPGIVPEPGQNDESLRSEIEEGAALSPAEDNAPDTKEEASGTDAPTRSLKEKVKRNIIRFGIIFAFLFIVFIGLTVLLYPTISNFVNNKNATRVISGYSDTIKGISEKD